MAYRALPALDTSPPCGMLRAIELGVLVSDGLRTDPLNLIRVMPAQGSVNVPPASRLRVTRRFVVFALGG